jgi:hypothetical protein
MGNERSSHGLRLSPASPTGILLPPSTGRHDQNDNREPGDQIE